MAVSVILSPIWNGSQFFDNNGNPLSGGKIFTYVSGSTSVQQPTYTDSTGNIANSNPIVLDSSGRIPVEMWLIAGQAYTFVLTLNNGTTVLSQVDGVTGIPSNTGGGTGSAAIWNAVTPVPTFLNSTSFLLAGNFAAQFAVGNRVRCTYPAVPTTYGTVNTVSYAGGNTTVVLINDAGTTINSTLNAVAWSSLVTNGITVDAGAVSVSRSGNYTTAGTVGNQLDTLNTGISTANTRITTTYTVLTAAGTDTYTATTDSVINSYTTGQKFTIKFTNANTGACTLNVNNIGAIPIYQYSSTGSYITAPTISAGMVSDVAYDGTAFVLLDSLPSSSTAPPHGIAVLASNATFTVPANVFYVKVTCVGGGGGGGQSRVDAGLGLFASGGNGGAGGVAARGIPVTPGTTYSVTIGTGGTYSTGTGRGGTGNTTSFGTLVSASGGQGGQDGSITGSTVVNGNVGTVGTIITGQYGYSVGGFLSTTGPRGTGGNGTTPTVSGTPGTAGICVIEW